MHLVDVVITCTLLAESLTAHKAGVFLLATVHSGLMDIQLDMVGGGEGALISEEGARLVMAELLMPQENLPVATPVFARTPITGPWLSFRRTPVLIVNTFLSRVDRSNLPVALGTCNRMLLSVVTKQEVSVDEMLGALPTSEVESLDFFFSGYRHPRLNPLKWHRESWRWWHRFDGLVLSSLPNLVTESQVDPEETVVQRDSCERGVNRWPFTCSIVPHGVVGAPCIKNHSALAEVYAILRVEDLAINDAKLYGNAMVRALAQ